MSDGGKLIAVPVGLREANAYVGEFHRHSRPVQRDGGKFAVGCGNDAGLWGVAIVGRPLSRIIAQDATVAEVLRVCTRPGAPKGSNSFLYGRCWQAWKALGGRRLVTYTLQTESGESLRGAGYRIVAELAPRSWVDRRDHLKREWQPVYGQAKLRWEFPPPEGQLDTPIVTGETEA